MTQRVRALNCLERSEHVHVANYRVSLFSPLSPKYFGIKRINCHRSNTKYLGGEGLKGESSKLSIRKATLRNPRQGLTLLEVILALAILAVAMGILAQLSGLGMRAAREARQRTRGQIYCESIMSEMTSGATLPSSTQGSVPDDPNWTYETIVEPADVNGMVRLYVIVQRADDVGIGSRFQLVRLIRDPDLPPAEDPAVETTSSNLHRNLREKERWG